MPVGKREGDVMRNCCMSFSLRSVSLRLRHFLLVDMLLCMVACGNLLPAARQDVSTGWQNFDDAKASYDKIVPYMTSAVAVRLLGFDPTKTANIQLLNQAQVVNAVLPTQLQDRSSVPQGILDCMQVQDACTGYIVEPSQISQKRIGSFLLDFLNFKRSTVTSGWKFSALIVVIDGLVVYKQWSGQPRIETIDFRVNPLGPLQSMGETLKSIP